MTITRRELLAAAGSAMLLGGCRTVGPICPNDPKWQRPIDSLTIDVHAHMFNGSDLQVAQFIHRIAAAGTSPPISRLAEVLGRLVQTVAWSLAPDTKAEMRLLRKLSSDLASCDPKRSAELLARIRQEKYSFARQEVRTKQRAMQSELALGASELRLEGASRILELPTRYEEFEEMVEDQSSSAEEFAVRRITISSALKFFIEMFQYRYSSLHLYLRQFSTRERAMDLVLPALVDYDWWLDKGHPTKSSLSSQVTLMTQTSIATQGRSHVWVPFCPFRELVHRAQPGRTFSSFELVKKAILEHGAIGVKIYSPMGFAALGNAALKGYWDGAEWLSEDARRADFGARLDTVLRDLYKWCEQEEVPLLAHSNESNAPSKEFAALAGPGYWRTALAEFPRLRVNFGHFSGANERTTPETVLRSLELLAQGVGNHRYADASYFSGVIDYPDELLANLIALLRSDVGQKRVLEQRLLFGTDWKMLAIEHKNSHYLAEFQQLMAKMQTDAAIPKLSQRFFGTNAVEFIGLRKEQAARRRLDAFYQQHKIAAPGWLQKVDAA